MRSLHARISTVVCRGLAGLAAVAVASAVCGCGGDAGPDRYDVSGTVTFNGQPVPAGHIIFEPDTSADNSGPQGAADIRDGKYDTGADGRGTVGGPHVVRISGFESFSEDENNPAKPLFTDYETTVDLPEETTTKDFDVPASAAQAGPPRGAPMGGP